MWLTKWRKRLKRRIGVFLTATMVTLPMSWAALPQPRAEANFDIFGAVVTGAISYAQIDSEINKYNKSEEGRQLLFQQMKNRYGVNNDPELNYLVDRIMNNLTAAIGSVDSSIYEMPYNYFINNQQGFNASCTLGHNLTINTGLFSVLNREDEIAVVLAHEMGHGQKNHVARGARESIGPQVLAAAVGGGILPILAARVLTNQGITKPMEREADSLAFEYLTHSEYNPGACAALWQRVIDKSGNNPDTFVDFLVGGSDHPSHASRRNDYTKKLFEYSQNNVEVKDGVISIRGKHFMTPAAYADMSGAERSYLIAGNLAKAYNAGLGGSDVTVQGNTVMMGGREIVSVAESDETADVLANRLSAIK